MIITSAFKVIGNSYIHARVREADLAIERSSIFYRTYSCIWIKL